MIDLEKIIKKLEDSNIEERTTKELKELGLNDYYIKKALEEGALEKVARGKYKVVNLNKDKKKWEAFKQFANAVFNNDFEAAYDHLLENYKNQTNHDYEHHIKMYFILLKELLGNSKDFSFLDDILTFSDTNAKNNTCYKYFSDFSTAVLASDFKEAYLNIGLFRNVEKERRGNVTISTKLFHHLSYNIVNNKNKQASQENTTFKPKVTIQNETERDYLYKKYYRNMMDNIDSEKYEEALENIKMALLYSRSKSKSNLENMFSLILKYLELSKSNTTLPESNFDYSEYNDDYNLILNQALNNHDYQTAYQNIGKCAYLNKNSVTLRLYKKLLHTLIEQNNQNQKKNKVLVKTKENKEEVPQGIEETKIDSTTILEEKPQDEVLYSEESIDEQQPIIPITINEIIDLVYDREYDKLKGIIKKQESTERIHRYILEMINTMDKITNIERPFREKQHNYRSDEYDVFKRFFEALNYQDYEEAYRLVEKCREISERRNDSKEFVIYQYMLEDISSLKADLNERLLAKQKLLELERKQKNLIHSRIISNDDIENIETITNEIIELSSGKNESSNKHILEMLDTLKTIRDYDLDENSFEVFTYSNKDIMSDFCEAIKIGDYQTANALSGEEKWNREVDKNPNRKYLIMYKKLLNQIYWSTKNNSFQKNILESSEEIIHNPVLDSLSELKALIKKRKYLEAYVYYYSHDFTGASPELNQELQVFIPFLLRIVEKEATRLEKEFKLLKSRGEYQEATQVFKEYKNYLADNYLNRNLDYYEARINSEEKEMLTSDFVEKEQLYDTAMYYGQQREYEKGIDVLTEYILKDNDLSAKGYLLRGRFYERIKKFAEAKADYEKAISIIPEPNAYHRLGKINVYQNEYAEAIKCFLEYEERRPNYHHINMKALSETYKAAGDEESSDKYKELIKIFPEKR